MAGPDKHTTEVTDVFYWDICMGVCVLVHVFILHCADWKMIRLASWIAIKSLYVLIQMMAADRSHKLPSYQMRDALINPVAATILL